MLKYKTFTVVTDNGPYVTKLILETPYEIADGLVDTGTFSVYAERRNPETGEVFLGAREWLGPKIYPSQGYRPVTAAYPCDENGKKAEKSKFIALEMPYGPRYPIACSQAAFNSFNHNVFVNYVCRVTQVKEIAARVPISGMVFDEFDKDICPQLKGWQNGKSHYKKLPLGYGWYAPDKAAAADYVRHWNAFYTKDAPAPEKFPLVIWIHGAGEGGSDPTVAYTGNNVVNLSSREIQNKLGGGAYILAPQTPTFWMDSGEENRDDFEEMYSPRCKYTEALKALIDEFVDAHKDIDRDRIYIGGCSNGGYMTMRMILAYPGYFAAAYPVCEPYLDSAITDEEFEGIKDLPIWFTQCAKDPLVPPETSVLPTYRRLKAAGNDNVHVSYFEKITDRTGLFTNADGTPYEYNGHFSWVYTYTDECVYDLDGTRVMHEGSPVTLWQWLGKQRRNSK